MKSEKPTAEKIRSTSKTLAVLFKIARVCCYVGIGVLSVGILYVMLFGNLDLLILHGKVIVHSPYALLDIAGISNWQIIFVSIGGIVDLILLSLLFGQARDVFKDISVDSSPFELKQVRRIRRIAVFYFVISLLDFETQALSLSFTVNLAGIVGALMFWCISLIFEYGCELQQQSDETL